MISYNQGLVPPEVWTPEYVRTELWSNVYGEELGLDETPDPDDYPREECRLLEWLSSQGCQTVLDVGCGWNQYRVPDGMALTGFDISPPMAELFTAMNPGRPFHLGTSFDLPFEDGAFAGVKSRGMLRHIKDWEPPLEEMVRVAEDRLAFTHLTGSAEEKCGPYQWCTTRGAIANALYMAKEVRFETWKGREAWDFESTLVKVTL